MPVQQNSHVVAHKRQPFIDAVNDLKAKLNAGTISEPELLGSFHGIEDALATADLLEEAYCIQRECEYDYVLRTILDNWIPEFEL